MENRIQPTKEDYKKREELANDPNRDMEYLEFMNNFNWSSVLFEENGNYGLKNALGEVIIPARYEDFSMLTEQEIKVGDPVVTHKNGKVGILKAGQEEEWLLEPEFDYVGYPAEYFSVRQNNKWGIYELETGEYKVPVICDQVESVPGFIFVNNMGFYKIGEKFGLINDQGDLTAAIFDEVDVVPEEDVKARIGDIWGFVNEKGELTEDEDEAYFWCDM